MLDGLGTKLERAAQRTLRGEPPVDPARFGDPVAAQTEWTRLGSGSANFRTHRLHEVDGGHMEFRTTAGAKLFWLVFLVVGVGVLVAFQLTAGREIPGLTWNADLLGAGLFAFAFAAIGAGGLYFSSAPIVFDLRRGLFWKGRKAPERVVDRRAMKYFAELNDVHALQLLRGWSTGKRRYPIHELNLVLRDARRVPVVAHGGSLAALRAEAERLASLLGRPLWDATR